MRKNILVEFLFISFLDDLVKTQTKEYHKMIGEYIEDLKNKRGNLDNMEDDNLENHLDAIMTENALLNDDGLDLIGEEEEDDNYLKNLGKYKLMMNMMKEENNKSPKDIKNLFK